MGVGHRTTIELECPFCKKGKIATFFVDSYRKSHTSSISNKKKVISYTEPAHYKILDGCPECGKSKKDVQDKFDGNYREPMTKEQMTEWLKKKGLPIVIESVKKED